MLGHKVCVREDEEGWGPGGPEKVLAFNKQLKESQQVVLSWEVTGRQVA